MHTVIDIIVGLILLFFLLSGWHKGFILSLLGVVRVVVSYGAAYASGRYLGFWLGEVTNRPRIVAIPVCAVLAFTIVVFVFHVIMHAIRKKHEEKEKNENYLRPIISCLSGGVINLSAGVLTLILLIWLADIFMVGITGMSLPGSADAHSCRLARRAIYETTYVFSSRTGNVQQASSIARIVSNPEQGLEHLGNILAADSVQGLLSDQQLPGDLLSGEPERIEHNPAVRQLFNDRATLDELKEMGLLSGYESKTMITEKLAKVGQNQRIQGSIENLKAKQLLSTDKIPLLIRDPDFDAIIAELVR